MPLEQPSPAMLDAKPAGRIGRIRGLDALRGLAALGVTLFHLTSQYKQDYKFAVDPSLCFPFGAHGVTLFFIISGFVIFMSLERIARPMDFVVARFSRLYPNYWAAVIISTFALSVLPLPDTAPGLTSRLIKAGVNMTMFQRWLRFKSIDPVYWTLEVEICFYLIMLVLLWRKALDKAVPVFVALTCLAIADQLLLTRGSWPLLDRLRSALILPYVNIFLIGMCIYKIRQTNHWGYWLALPLCLIAPASRGSLPGGLTDTAFLAAFAAIVLLATADRLPFLENPLLQFLGIISYSLYLIHYTVGHIAIYRLIGMGVGTDSAVALAIAISVALATAMTFAIEKPAMRLIRNYRKSKVIKSEATSMAPIG